MVHGAGRGKGGGELLQVAGACSGGGGGHRSSGRNRQSPSRQTWGTTGRWRRWWKRRCRSSAKLDIMVANAGTKGHGKATNRAVPRRLCLHDPNHLMGAFNCSRAALPHSEKQCEGRPDPHLISKHGHADGQRLGLQRCEGGDRCACQGCGEGGDGTRGCG